MITPVRVSRRFPLLSAESAILAASAKQHNVDEILTKVWD